MVKDCILPSLLAFHPGFHPDIAREKSRIGR